MDSYSGKHRQMKFIRGNDSRFWRLNSDVMYVPTACWTTPEISNTAQPKCLDLQPGEGMVWVSVLGWRPELPGYCKFKSHSPRAWVHEVFIPGDECLSSRREKIHFYLPFVLSELFADWIGPLLLGEHDFLIQVICSNTDFFHTNSPRHVQQWCCPWYLGIFLSSVLAL